MNRKELDKKIKATCHELRYTQGYISSISVLNKLGYLSESKIKEWKSGKIPYLEKVCTINLTSLSFINKTIRKYAKELKLKGSITDYTNKRNKSKLVFSKSNDRTIEIAYSTHYVDIDRIEELKNTNK